jgi:hypothetical protein
LRRTLNDLANLSSFQWAQWFAYAREYRPDLIIELGRSKGSSTAVLAEALYQNQLGKLVSLCETKIWNETSSELLRPLVEAAWFERLDIRAENPCHSDFESIAGDAQRILVVWDAAGFALAEAVLGRLMPILQDRKHVVIMHDVSDLRYCGSRPAYGDAGLWQGSDRNAGSGGDSRLYLGWMDTAVEQAIAAVDFLARNRSTLESADHSFHQEIGVNVARRKEMQSLLSPEDFSLLGHWAYFSLNGVPGSYTFPKINSSGPARLLDE